MNVKKEKAKRPVGAPLIYTPKVIEKLADDLEKWSIKPEANFLEGFIAQCGLNIANSDMSEFSSKNEKFRATLTRVKFRLVDRIKTKGCNRAFDGSFVAKILPLVDMEYRKWRQEELQIEHENMNKAFKLLIHPDRLKNTKEIKNEVKK